MAVLLVRHADAGDRWAWTGDDRLRPLSAAGRSQADGIVGMLGARALTAVMCSPALRCVQTVEPLAAARGLRVEVRDVLAEGHGRRAADLVDELIARGVDAVLCSHGDVIPDVLDRLAWRGVALDPGGACPTASVWVVGPSAATYLGSP